MKPKPGVEFKFDSGRLFKDMGDPVNFTGELPQKVLEETNQLYFLLFEDEASPLKTPNVPSKEQWNGILMAAGCSKILEELEKHLKTAATLDALCSILSHLEQAQAKKNEEYFKLKRY